jgi:hypothetical protein
MNGDETVVRLSQSHGRARGKFAYHWGSHLCDGADGERSLHIVTAADRTCRDHPHRT